MVSIKKEESPESSLSSITPLAGARVRCKNETSDDSTTTTIKEEDDTKPLSFDDHAVASSSSSALQLFQAPTNMDPNDPNYSLQGYPNMYNNGYQQVYDPQVALSTALNSMQTRIQLQSAAILELNTTIGKLKNDNTNLLSVLSGINKRLCEVEAKLAFPQPSLSEQAHLEQPLPQQSLEDYQAVPQQPFSQQSHSQQPYGQHSLNQQLFEQQAVLQQVIPQQAFAPQSRSQQPLNQQPDVRKTVHAPPISVPSSAQYSLSLPGEDPFVGEHYTELAAKKSQAGRGADNRSRSPTPTPDGHGFRLRDPFAKERESTMRSSQRKGPVQLRINTSGTKNTAVSDDVFPTPLTMTANTGVYSGANMTLPTPHKVPATPVHLGPPSDATKSLTSVTKRNVHNLSKMVPHANAQIPPLALTDTEVIVFFFNALARPIVSLRLYANEWGPKSICQVLNGHRYIEPHYLRNTCSVKCTTAIKNGREKFGPEWEEKNRTLLARTDTTKATDMIRLADDDADVRYVDWDLREFCNGLTKFPTVGEQGGLFTQCVQYCFENDYACTLSNILEFSKKLEAGQLPPGRPVPNSLSPMPLNGLAADELQGLDADAMFEDTMFQDEMVQDPINGSQNSMFSMFHQLDDTDDVGFRH